jgi:DNA-binding NarL/FixJ family response regulator
MSITVMLADDHTVVRHGLALFLKQTAGINVVGEAGNGREAVEMAVRLKPHVIVMDIDMPELNGVDATREIIAKLPNICVLAFSAFANRGHVLGALRAGAAGYVVKDCVAHELVEAIQTVAKGERYVSARLRHSVIYDSLVNNSGGVKDRLTTRETEVLQLLAEGKAMKQVGQVLSISTKTVETHRRAVMEKLQLFSTAELTKHAIREGLTTLD